MCIKIIVIKYLAAMYKYQYLKNAKCNKNTILVIRIKNRLKSIIRKRYNTYKYTYNKLPS